MSANNLLLRHNYVAVPAPSGYVGKEQVATILMNLSYYGYALSMEAYKAVIALGPTDLVNWWKETEADLKSITGDDRKIGDFVVYKNFPAEVLDKTAAEYWIPQILMYWGFSKEFFTEEVKPREKMNEQPRATVLKLAKSDTLSFILNSYLAYAARWKKQELTDVLFLSQQLPVNLSKIGFKENLVSLASFMIEHGITVKMNTATDVLRLAAGLSDGDVSLREKFKFKSFKKSQRRFILSMLEECSNLTEDVARRPELWKRLFHNLHAGDYKRSYPKVIGVMDSLYNGNLVTFNSKVEKLLSAKDVQVLDVLRERPGDFRRRLVHTLDLFNDKAVKAFISKDVLSKLTTSQLVTLRTYLKSSNQRSSRVYPPRGNWTKMQIGQVRPVKEGYVEMISEAINNVLHERLPPVKYLDPSTAMIKLPSNDGEVSPYNRGTVFMIPDTVKFIRTASYWKNNVTTWFDNGWNFFDKNWKDVGSCSWTATSFPQAGWNQKATGAGAVFSGDPVNSAEMKGRAAQLIDLYPDKLRKQGVRFAVWSILCYSNIPFSKAEEVFAALQWGEDPQKGNLFEPSRCQLQFPLKGDSLTKYVCVIDFETMSMTYIDANLYGNVRTASSNGKKLEKNMPAFMEYISALPSVHDLFQASVNTNSNGPYILYSDKDKVLKDVDAYVFKPENKESKYKEVDINKLLT